ncbi:MAG: hypothetical protein K2H72_07600 [Muribaculaceae bacterium]|nr:hypothetical protein [Muribaculaceae bacterium]
MAIPTETGTYVVIVADTILTKGKDMVNILEATTNQYDRDISTMICVTIMVVCLFVCAAVFACFIVVSRIKRHAREKEFELEVQKLDKKEEIWKLKNHEEDLKKEYDLKLKKELWEVEKQKEAFELKKQKEMLEFEKQKENSDLSKKYAISEAVDKVKTEWLASLNKAQNAESEKKSKEKKDS